MKSILRAAWTLLVLVSSTPASGAAITIPIVRVGNPGNPGDAPDPYTGSSYGGVDYAYAIGTTEVTNAQYVTFLNSVAADDLHGLYNTKMEEYPWGGIVRSGSPGTYSYAVKSPDLNGNYDYDDKPVVFVGWGDAARFANWLQNGQPTGAQDASTTEDGTYSLNGVIFGFNAVTRNAGSRWFLPAENEWYKAAYYNPATSSYFQYPTGSDTVPNNNPPSADTGNSANFYNSGYTTGDSIYTMTDVGAYTLSHSPYGTSDQGGNVSEWTEGIREFNRRVFRGGNWFSDPNTLRAGNWQGEDAVGEFAALGFRVATVPEPSTLCLSVLTAATLIKRRRQP